VAVAGLAVAFSFDTVTSRALGVWSRLAYRLVLTAATVLCIVAYAMTFDQRHLDEEFAELTQDRVPLDWENRTIEHRNLAGSDLRGTVATNAKLLNVVMTDADLSGSDLRGVDFSKADLTGAILCGVDVRGADFRHVRNFDKVADLRFLIYDDDTKFPGRTTGSDIPGAIQTERHSVLYSCDEGTTHLLRLVPEGAK
jgi:hypothetical protein